MFACHLEKSGGLRLAGNDCDNRVKILWYNVPGKIGGNPSPHANSMWPLKDAEKDLSSY